MEHIISIQDFEPVKNAVLDLEKNFQVLIGMQASGKSTICKVLYFCQKVRDYTLEFLLEPEQFTKNHKNEYFNNYLKYLTRQFMGCFGKTTHMKRFNILYKFDGSEISISLNTDGYVRFRYDTKLRQEIQKLIEESSAFFLRDQETEKFVSIMDSVAAMSLMKQQMKQILCRIFCNDAEIIYIPAGRSLLATMSEQLHEFSISDMDVTMREFVKLIRSTKSRFGTKIPSMVKEYTKTVKGQINNLSVEQAYILVKKILKADYTSESEGEKIYFDQYHWVKLMYGSSGQQEALWILMLIFVTILENKNTFMVIEEPEAHLFPIAQRDMINLISLMVNTTGSKIIITTHSPYILTSTNILLYSDKVERGIKDKEKIVIPERHRISYKKFAAYQMGSESGEENCLCSLMDEETHMIRTDYIDEVSTITNVELDSLINMEMENDLQ